MFVTRPVMTCFLSRYHHSGKRTDTSYPYFDIKTVELVMRRGTFYEVYRIRLPQHRRNFET